MKEPTNEKKKKSYSDFRCCSSSYNGSYKCVFFLSFSPLVLLPLPRLLGTIGIRRNFIIAILLLWKSFGRGQIPST